jgi:heat shock protein HslJ
MRIVLAAAALGLATMTGCATPSEPAPAARPAADPAVLKGGPWTVTEIAGQPKLANSKVDITFEDGRVFGAASCNRFMGGYEVAGDGLTLKMSQMASTMMACPDALMAQERLFLDTLGAVTRWSVTDGVLALSTPDGKAIKARR